MIWFFDLSGHWQRKTSKEDSLRISKEIDKIFGLTELHRGEIGDIYAPSVATLNIKEVFEKDTL